MTTPHTPSDTSRPHGEPIPLTRPVLPDLSQLARRLEAVWERQRISNGGAEQQRLEADLSTWLGCRHLSLFNNGTTALLVALRVGLALDQRPAGGGEVITTPLTFAATTHAIAWSGLTPVFCDVDPERLTVDPARIEALITPHTRAILGVHLYGNPCATEAIQALAERYHLPVIYDAAHAFGVEYRGRPIGQYGDLSVFSFHPTKLFHTAEGGALAAQSAAMKQAVDLGRNFGLQGDLPVGSGINGKMNEIQAVLGQMVLEAVDGERRAREQLRARYRQRLATIPGVRMLEPPPETVGSELYLAVRIAPKAFGADRDALHHHLRQCGVETRRYFGLTSHFPLYRTLPSAADAHLPHALRASTELLCLPFFGQLGLERADTVVDLIARFQQHGS